MSIKQAVIPAAGLGSRFLPVTKTVPKELLPLLDKPCIEHVIDEAIAAGVEEFVIVISSEKKGIQKYFEHDERLESWLKLRKQDELLSRVQKIESKAKYHFVFQDQPLGLGHAVLCAREKITDDHFFVLLPDDVIDADVAVTLQMQRLFARNKKPIVSVMEVPWDDVHRYGIVQAAPLSDNLGFVQSIVEKPARQDAPSNLAVIGRYLLPQDIFKMLESTKPGAGGEIQLTDALKMLVNTSGLNAYTFDGDRYDTGNPVGLLIASMALAIKHPQFKDTVGQFIKTLAVGV